jgi:peptide/nickel transport system substrate-binding protein
MSRFAWRRFAAAFLAIAVTVFMAFESSAITLRVARNQIPPSLGNPYTSGGQPGAAIWSALFDALTVVEPNGDLSPGLALRWDIVTPTVWRFHLRPNVVFHDGTAFDANTVVANIKALQSEAGKTLYMAAEVASIKDVKAVAPLVVDIETLKPDAILAKRLAVIMIVQPDLWAKDKAAFALKPVGTGPWQLVDWGRSSGRSVFTAHKKSYRAPKQLDRLEIVILPEATTRLSALLTGEVDVAEAFSPDDLSELEGQPLRAVMQPGTQVMAIAFRTVGAEKSPLRDQRVRQALNYAVDRAEIVETIMHGQSKVASQGCTAVVFGCNPALVPYPYDPAKAKALLAEAGYAKGFKLKVEVLTGFGLSDQLIYQRMAEQLRQVGVIMTIETPSYPTWLRKYSSGQWGDTDAFSLFWDNSSYRDVIRAVKYYSCDKPNPFFCEPSIMPQIYGSDHIMDVAQRRAALEAIMAKLKDLAPSLWMVEIPYHYAMTNDIEHFATRTLGVSYEDITFAPGKRK